MYLFLYQQISFLEINIYFYKVMVAGFGRKGHAKGDIPGVRFKVIAVKGFGLRALYLGKVEKK